MTGRVAQVLYTASSLDPATKVWLEVEGKPLEVLGGEGLMIDQPLTRENFKKNFEL
jgi:spore germination protein GerM